MRPRLCGVHCQSGFSFIELVVVIVLMGIMGVGVVSFINNSARSYDEAANRNQLTSAGRIVLEQMAMELRNSLPESIRVSSALSTTNIYGYAGDQCLEFIPIEAATTYLNPVFRPNPASAAAFNVVKLIPDQVGKSGRYAVIYPTKEQDLYKDTFTDSEAIVAVTIASVDAGRDSLTPQAAHRFTKRSAEERLFITTEPVSYCVSNNKLYRYANYGFHADQQIPEGPNGDCAASCLPATTPNRELISNQIDNSVLAADAFDFLSANRRRNGVIQIELNFSLDGENIWLNHEVMQQASP